MPNPLGAARRRGCRSAFPIRSSGEPGAKPAGMADMVGTQLDDGRPAVADCKLTARGDRASATCPYSCARSCGICTQVQVHPLSSIDDARSDSGESSLETWGTPPREGSESWSKGAPMCRTLWWPVPALTRPQACSSLSLCGATDAFNRHLPVQRRGAGESGRPAARSRRPRIDWSRPRKDGTETTPTTQELRASAVIRHPCIR